MKKAILTFFLLFSSWSLFNSTLQAQEDTIPEKRFRNTIRLNITNPMIFGDRSLVVGYERTLGDHQSFSLNVGQSELPEFGLFDPDEDNPEVQLTKNSKGKGFNLTGDYRFYLASENRHLAPRGVYVGPYASYVTMGRENTWLLDTDNHQGEVKTDFNLSFFSIGAQLGYQFIFWNRLAVDLILIGPGIAAYQLEAKLDTDLDPGDEEELYQKISDALNERFPGYNFAVDDIDFRKTGTSNVTSFGYRYVVHLGFRF